jgi:uncharacterized protein (DUF885 family)
MKKIWKVLGWIGLAVLLVGGYAGYRIAFGKPFTINQLANRQALLFLIDNPELFTQVGIVDGTVLDWHSGKLAAVGVKKRDDDYAAAERFVRQVKEFDRSKLNRQDQLTYDILLDQYETALSFKPFDWLSSEGLYPIAPMWGTQVQLPNFLETQHVVKNAKTARNYVKRLEATGGKLDAVTAEMLRQSTAGVVLPISLLEKSESGIKDTVQSSPKDSPLVTTFVERMKGAKGLDAAEQSELTRQATDAVKNGIYPAFARMTAALESQRPAAVTQAAGVGRLPDGAAYYAAALKQMTTTDYTPDQVHQLGLSEVARVGAEMETLLQSQGLTTGTVAERVQALHKDPRFLLPNTDEGRKQLLAKYQQILDEVNARMPEYFRTVPPEKLLVQRVPYAEGWALYAERFAAEIGMYKDDPFGDLGRLEAEMFRAARLVVDTGLHAKSWTREQAIAYMVSTTGMNESEVVTEVERYMGQPGQACAYKVGQHKILELRERAKATLGPKFDLKDFHAVVLENGGVPLTLLESQVDEWIAKTKG